MDAKEIKRRWNNFANEYAATHGEYGDIHKEIVLNPAIFSLIGMIENKEVLDAGCGEGYLSRLLAKEKARVTGVDYSTRMIEIAEERTNSNLAIKYFEGNCEKLDFLADESFDLVISNMVVQDLPEYESALKEMYRILKPNGELVFSILHPCFVTPNSGWEKDINGDKLFWRVDNYFYEGAYRQKLGKEADILFFHRTLTTYLTTLLKIGFNLDSLLEPKPSEEVLAKYPSFEEDLRCADFIVFKLKK